MPQQLDLIEVSYSPDQRTARIDTNGQRVLRASELCVVASRLLDAAVNTSAGCPLVPFGDQIIVSIIYEEGRVSAGNVAIPDTAMEGSALRGVVEAVGPRVRNRAWWQFWIPKEWNVIPQPGDIVTFSPHAGTVTKVGDSRYLTMKAVYALTKIVLDVDSDNSNTASRPAA